MDAHHDECWIHCCFKPRNGEASLLESCEPLYCKKRCIRKQPTHPPIPSHQDTVQSFIMTPCYSRINLRRPYFNHQGNARWRLIIERLTTGDERSKTKSGNWEKPAQNSCFVPRNILDSWSAIKSIICFLTSSCLNCTPCRRKRWSSLSPGEDEWYQAQSNRVHPLFGIFNKSPINSVTSSQFLAQSGILKHNLTNKQSQFLTQPSPPIQTTNTNKESTITRNQEIRRTIKVMASHMAQRCRQSIGSQMVQKVNAVVQTVRKTQEASCLIAATVKSHL